MVEWDRPRLLFWELNVQDLDIGKIEHRGNRLAKPNYQQEKRKRELAKKKKQEEKRKNKLEKANQPEKPEEKTDSAPE